MAKKKKGPFGKKAARSHAAAAAAAAAAAGKASAATNAATAANRAGGGRWQPRRGAADAGWETAAQPGGMGMQDIARNTTNKTAHWEQGTRLRDRPVPFVSGGLVEPLTERELSGDARDKTKEDGVPSTGQEHQSVAVERAPEPALPAPDPLPEEPANKASDEVVKPVDLDLDSGDEIILFKGRHGPGNTQPQLAGLPVVKPVLKPTADSTPAASKPADTPTPPVAAPGPSDPDRLELLLQATDEDGGSDAAVNDYIANMDSEDMQDMMTQLAANRRDLGGSHDDVVIYATTSDEESDEAGDIVGDNAHRHPLSSDDEEGPWGVGGLDDTAEESEDADEDSDDAWPLAADLDDEQLARLLAKQEELGLGSDELILLDGDASRTAAARRASRNSRPGRQAKQAKQKASLAYDFRRSLRGSDGSYPNAEAVADAFERLKVTGRAGRKDEFELELSDSELEATLRASWQKDRARKKDKKKEREDLRAQGLLRNHANPDDPRIKYPTGMSIDELKAEFHAFLLGSENSAALPPMDAHARKVVHEIAYRFNVGSKSTGSGDQRRPMLVRKKATARFNEGEFHSVFAKYQRRFFARLDGRKVGAGSLKGAASGFGRRGGGVGAAAVRNGEIVGGSAPEIGQENKGRTMLEKMGWSSGMALGIDNKGITQPIEHVVKRSKAGLG